MKTTVQVRLLALAAMLLMVLTGCQTPPPELQDIGQVPEFSFTDQSGQALGTKELAGKPWVANFLFTSCPTACPPLAKATAQIQNSVKSWADGPQYPVKLVSISIDPVTDTPERLAEFGKEHGADPKMWHLVRGEYDAMEKLVTDGFMMPLMRKDMVEAIGDKTAIEDVKNRPTPVDTAHSISFVLVDGKGRIRGIFRKDDEDLKLLDAALRHLVNNPDA